MISLLSKTIDRTKLAAITDDFETIKYFENLQRDLAGPISEGIGGSDDLAHQAIDAATAAQAAADAAQISATAAQNTGNSALLLAGSASSAASAAQTDATYAKNLSNTINADYVSKTQVTAQSVAGSFQAPAFLVGGLQVVGARATGWTAGTGTPNKGAFAANTTYTVSAAYTQAEVTAIASALTQANQRILALESAMRTHGLIN